jgi:hypothetical protein
MQDVPQEAVVTRTAAEASPLPVKAPRKTVEQIRKAKAKAEELFDLADSLAVRRKGGTTTILLTREKLVQAQR